MAKVIKRLALTYDEIDELRRAVRNYMVQMLDESDSRWQKTRFIRGNEALLSALVKLNEKKRKGGM